MSNQKPQIAVLIPTFNPGNYLHRCLNSLNMQTLSKDQFCVYIGLNGDVEKYTDYVRSLLSGMNFNFKFHAFDLGGVSHARNKLLESSVEDYICFVDDDDLLSPNYLENLLSVSSPVYIGVSNVKAFEVDVEDARENFLSGYYIKMPGVEKSKFKSRKYYSPPWAKLLHRNMIGDFRFDEQLEKGEDSLFMALISKNVVGIRKAKDNACYFVNERTGSVTRRKVQFFKDFKTLLYLNGSYMKLLLSKDYDPLFIFTRILATQVHLLKLISIRSFYFHRG